jgi:tetratricopeptide (TPR) repeat protein
VSRDGAGNAIELRDLGDGFAEWFARHAKTLGAIAASLLLGSAGYALYTQRSASNLETAAAEVARIRRDFATKMGANPNAIDIPELANKELAKQIEIEHATRFREAAESHAGSPIAALAWLEAGELLARSGDSAGSIEAFRAGAASDTETIGAAVQMRLAQALETSGKVAEAADAFEKAAGVVDFPLRPFALAEAARCQEQAGNSDRARSLYELAEGLPNAASLPESARARLRELRAQRGDPPAPPAQP